MGIRKDRKQKPCLKHPEEALWDSLSREHDQHLLHLPAGHPMQSDALIDLYNQK